MADATTKAAPLIIEVLGQKVTKDSKEHKALTMEFEQGKKYMFELAEQVPLRENAVVDMVTKRNIPHKKFKPFQNLVFTSQIVWNGGRVNIRYYDGCESIFVSDQPKDKDVVDQLIRQTQQRSFLDGKLGVYGDEKQLLMYLYLCSWNGESNFRTRTSSVVFVPVDKEKEANLKASKLDKIEEAIKLAKDATTMKMTVHANYLGIAAMDYDSGNELTEGEIRTAYREAAINDPDGFIESYGNKAIELKYYIDKSLAEGIISNKFNANKATWGKNNTEICDISGLKSMDAISERVLEFCLSDEGKEIATQLKALFNN